MIGNLVRKYGEVIRRDYIEETVRKFNKVREIVFYKGDLEQIVDSYLHYDRLISDFEKNIQKMRNDISRCKKLKYDVLNSSIQKLRSEGKLIDWLNDLNDKDLTDLKNIVDIENEFRKIDDFRFNERKRSRGKTVIQY